MSNPRKIEHLDPAESLKDDDLLFASVRDARDIYVSKKVTLANIVNYVKNYIGDNVQFGGGVPLIFDTSYEAVHSDDRIWGHNGIHSESNGIGILDNIEHTFARDCLFIAYCRYVGSHEEYEWNGRIQIFLDNHELSARGLVDGLDDRFHFFIKKGQKLKFVNVGDVKNDELAICTLPIKSGGIFFDTGAPATDFIMHGELPQDYTIRVSRKSLVTSKIGGANSVTGNNTNSRYVTINGSSVWTYQGIGSDTTPTNSFYYLDEGQSICLAAGDDPYLISGHGSNGNDVAISPSAVAGGYCVFPILDSGSESSSGGNHSGTCGYEMIDTSEDGDGIYTAETISQYTSNSSKNYLWTLSVGSATGTVTSLEKTVSKDCLVWLNGIVNSTDQVKIDNIGLKMRCFMVSGDNYRFYLKSGQKLFVGSPTTGNVKVSIIPLKSGGKFYFDTSKPDKFYKGIVGPINSPQKATGDTNIFPGQAYMNNQSNKPAITVDCPTMFACTYWGKSTMASNDLLNGKKIWSDDIDCHSSYGGPSTFIILDAGDTLTPYTANPVQDSIQLDWIAYPLLMDSSSSESEPESEPEYVQLWAGGPFWATRNMGANREEEEGEFFQYGSLVGYKWTNSLWQGNGTYDFSFSEQVLPKKQTNPYVYRAQELFDMGWIKQTYQFTNGTTVSDLTPEHDAATKQLGASWKIPSVSEWEELINNCNISNDTVKGKPGIRFTGKGEYSNMSIFLPPAGCADYTGHRDTGSIIYMTSTLGFTPPYNNTNYAYGFLGIRGTTGAVPSESNPARGDISGYSNRFIEGFPIRPIKVVS